MRLTNAVDAFILSKQIEGLSPNTIRNYSLHLKRLQAQVGPDRPIGEISLTELRQFLHRLQVEAPESDGPIPHRAKPLSAKTVKNVHTGLSSFWEWAISEGLLETNPLRQIKPPQPKLPTIQPFTKAEVKAILLTARQEAHSRELALRDNAIILFLLDTGVRNSELCGLTVGDLDFQTGAAKVRGKGRKDQGQGRERIVYFSVTTTKALHRYWLHRGKPGAKEPFFINTTGRPMKRAQLTRHIKRLGDRAGVEDCFPHKFRHTFAIQFLRNGGNVYALQRILGHSDLTMSQRYLAIVQSDLETAHQKSSPVDRWNL